MSEIMFFFAGALLLGIILFLVPNKYSTHGKTVILVIALLLSGFGLIAKSLIPIWQAVLIMIVLALLVSYLVEQKIGGKIRKQEEKTKVKGKLQPLKNVAEEEEQSSSIVDEDVLVEKENFGEEKESVTTIINPIMEEEVELPHIEFEEEFLQARAEAAVSISEEVIDSKYDEESIPELTEFPEVRTEKVTETLNEDVADSELDDEELRLYKELYKEAVNQQIESKDTEVEIEELIFTDSNKR
ncbi:hypothetical protein [Bacillus pinisoli]|uniref:hypothetical protein n=1 Tax=Bacillus pinisoli TaxID=2901866 RepID=UPI001FF1A61F|nr:hypothetical protein [Bacillus pinisoli]